MRVSVNVAVAVLSACAACSDVDTDRTDGALTQLEPVEFDATAGTVSVEFRDALSDLVDGASIVAIGESRHDTHEQFLAKAAIVRILISDFGYRTLVLEESFSHALLLDEFVTNGAGDVRSELSGLAGWYLWDTEESVDLLNWIRDYNASLTTEEKVRVLGMDVTAPFLGITKVAAFAQELEPGGDWSSRDYGAELHQGDFWPTILDRYRSTSDQSKALIAKNLEDLAAFVDAAAGRSAKGSLAELHLMQIQAEIGKIGHAMFSATSIAEIGVHRERGMARAVAWIDEEVAHSGGMILWTHNLHAAKTTFRMPQMGSEVFTPLGVLLSRTYGSKYRAIGGTFGAGSFSPEYPPGERRFPQMDSSTVDGKLAQLADSEFLLVFDRDTMAEETAQWFLEEREWRMQDASAFLSPLEGFDAIYFVPNVSRAELTPGALERYSVWN